MTAAGNLRGICLMTASMALFAVEDMFLKWAASALPVGLVILVSGGISLCLFAPLVWQQGQRIWCREALHPAVILRNLGEMLAGFGFVTALASVPLATVAAVLQATPLAVTLAAMVFLGEKVGWRRWITILAGFAGVLLVIRPGAEGFHPASLWVLMAVAGAALRDVASRAVPATTSTAQLSAWGVMAVVLLGGGMVLIAGGAPWPTASQSAVLAGAALFGSAGYWAITAASRTGEVSVVTPFRYTRLIFSLLVGVGVFAERPDVITLLGAAIIIASGLYSFARERALSRQAVAG
jgi:drug/metabolite transporter (DMT)-like permease